MASLSKSNGKTIWKARIRVNGKQRTLSTKVRREPEFLVGYSQKQKEVKKRQLENLAQDIANALEATQNGQNVDLTLLKQNALKEMSEKDFLSLFPKAKSKCPSVETYLTEWLKNRERERQTKRQGKNLQQGNNRDLSAVKYFLNFLGDRKQNSLDSITRDDVFDFIVGQQKRVRNSTIRIYCDTLAGAFNKAVTSEMLMKSPFYRYNHTKLLSKAPEVKEAFSPEQLTLIREHLSKNWLNFFNTLLFTGGQRLGDIALLEWKQVSFSEDSEGLYGSIKLGTMKTDKQLSIPIIKNLYEILSEIKAKADPREEFVFPYFSKAYKKSGAVKISNEFGAILKECGLRSEADKCAGDRRHVYSLSLHCLRATAVTEMRDNGVPADLCREIVGHNCEEIERVYYRTTNKRKAEAMTKVLGNL